MSFTGNPKRDAYIMRALVATIDAGETVTVQTVGARLPEKFDLLLSELADAKRGLELANEESAPVSENGEADMAAPVEMDGLPPVPFTSEDLRLALAEQQDARVALVAAQRAKANTSGRVIAERERLAANRPPTMTQTELMQEHLATQHARRVERGASRGQGEKMRRNPVRGPDGRMYMPAIGGRREGVYSPVSTGVVDWRGTASMRNPNETGSENGV